MAPHTAKERSVDQLLCHGVPPAPVYKGARGEEAGPRRGRAKCGVLLPPGVGSPLPCWSRRRGKRGRGRRKGGLRPLSNSDQRGGAGLLPFGLSPLFPYGPIRPICSPANSRNSPVLRKIPESLRTFPISKYSRPIYRSLRLDHFETPRHVHDLIRDSEQPSVHQITYTHKYQSSPNVKRADPTGSRTM